MVTYRNPNTETVWYCWICKKQQEADRTVIGVKVFLRYVDDIVRTVKDDPVVILEAANKLHPNLHFTIEELDSNGNLAFWDLNVIVDSGKKRSLVVGTKNPLIPARF